MSVTPGSHCPTCGQPKGGIFKLAEPEVVAFSPQHLAASAGGGPNGPWWHRILNALEPFEPLLLDALQKFILNLGK
jgi:hypothetical protein